MNRSVADAGGAVLVVSQFTLYGDTSGGRRPSWAAAARPEHAEPLVDAVVAELRRLGATVATGRFRADMQVELVNDGPVTVVMDLRARSECGSPHGGRPTLRWPPPLGSRGASRTNRQERHDQRRVAERHVPRVAGAQLDRGG